MSITPEVSSLGGQAAAEALTPEERVLRARLAGHAKWAATDDRTEATAAARANGPGQLPFWERKVDPENQLDPVTRAKKAENARSEHYARMQYLSVRARRARKAQAQAGGGQ